MNEPEAHRIDTRERLEAALGKPSLGVLLKSVDAIDAPAAAVLAVSRLGVLAAVDGAGQLRAWPVGARPSVARVLDPHRIAVPPHPDAPRGVTPVAALFLVPGLGETLRVNGTLHPGESESEIHVEEVFLHCAKALIRSKFWQAASALPAPEADAERFLERSPFLALASLDAAGRVDVSPRGDPPGFVQRGDAGTLLIPDRPGNRRTDTFHNVVEDSRVALLAFVPGSEQALSVSGRASLRVDPALRERLAVQGKPAIAALVVAPERMVLSREPAIGNAAAWDLAQQLPPAALPRAADVLAAHVRANKRRGVLPSLIRTLATANVIERGLAKDYDKRLY